MGWVGQGRLRVGSLGLETPSPEQYEHLALPHRAQIVTREGSGQSNCRAHLLEELGAVIAP